MAWQDNLKKYSSDNSAGYKEIERAQKVYNQKKSAGDLEGAKKAHTWANQIRDAMGVSDQYDRTTGARKSNVVVSQTKEPSYQDRVNEIYDAQRESRLSQLRNARDKAVGQLDQQKKELKPQFRSMRNQTDAQNVMAAQRLKELMAAQGLGNSGDNVTGQVALSTQRQGDLANINLAEEQRMGDINRRISDLNDPAEENALMSALSAERAQALLNADRWTQEDAIRQEQQDLQRRQIIAGLTGIDPVTGDKTYDATLNDRSFGLQQAGLTGMYDGQMTPEYRSLMASLTGIDPVTGKPTFQREQFNADNSYKNRSLAQRNSGGSNAAGDSNPSKGEAYDSAYSTLDQHIAKGTASAWLEANRSALIDALGVSEYNRMKEYALEKERGY